METEDEGQRPIGKPRSADNEYTEGDPCQWMALYKMNTRGKGGSRGFHCSHAWEGPDWKELERGPCWGPCNGIMLHNMGDAWTAIGTGKSPDGPREAGKKPRRGPRAGVTAPGGVHRILGATDKESAAGAGL